ncbi:MAG: DUF1844 domain-containing protein [Thermoanaerobaculia bacterium]
MPEEKKPAQSIKVTDRRLFTAEGDIREEFRESVKPSDPNAPRPEPPKPPEPPPPSKQAGAKLRPDAEPESESLFMSLVELLVYQASVALQTQQPEGARSIIELIDMLAEKTAGNLTPGENEFLEARRGALKLAYVQRTKRI